MERSYKYFIESLGLKINEKFKIKGSDESELYRFSEEGLQYYNDSRSRWYESDIHLNQFLDINIIKIPRKPKMYEKYYYISGYKKDPLIVQTHWTNEVNDFIRLKVGNVFFSEEEARKNINSLFAELENFMIN